MNVHCLFKNQNSPNTIHVMTRHYNQIWYDILYMNRNKLTSMHNIDEMRISMPEMCVGKGGELVVPTSRKIKARPGWIKASDAFDF